MTRSQHLRVWQREAFDLYQRKQPSDFLTVATPGAGKTTFALTIAADLLARGVVERVVIVAPTDHLKTQWALAAAGIGIMIDPGLPSQGALGAGFQGFAVTYAGIAVNPNAYRARIEHRSTMVILDEVHHAGDALTWGDGIQEACEPAVRRLALTGTPFRSDENPIPFVTYAPQSDGSKTSVADYSYGYGQALKDGVVRPVLFMAYSGQMHWRTRAGDEVAARLGEPLDRAATAQALRTALDPNGSWIPEVLSAAHKRLQEVRRDIPDAGGLVIASDQDSARAYASVLADLTGTRPTVVLSDEAGSSAKIAEFSAGMDPWMVAVRMVSEGVDIPRLAVGVYATTTSTPLYFAQAVGRFVRARRKGETASIFLPSVPRLLALASDLETQRDHVVGRPVKDETDLFAAEAELLAKAQQDVGASEDQLGQYRALASDASFDRLVYDGGEFGYDALSDDQGELDFLGIPGLLEPDQVAELLRSARAKRARERGTTTTAPAADVAFERRSELRRELQALVGAWHHRTGAPHGVTHSRLRAQCGGPPAAQASSEQLQERIDALRAWALKASS
ncbi:DEAD/DEAH box helicase [Aeromicrobium wangtongii]|uniref:DEAD/DEAH box helicase n=1 Tax=Aeromicrobium wangtongii TaxID=2969247 RepID=A0ABY5MD88_9ACTN|nr:DEAD/DEAH box helicase [Aeromicrobium wangtongii]MCD9197141.1 DEAD/DEAH box helicase [Aeromicrobium wangtongii]UUP14638.1 DEAD/DEAH box helicase [Aeromicrobium wangtongii]